MRKMVLVLDLTNLPRSDIYGMHVKSYTVNGETFYTVRAFSRDTIVGQITIKSNSSSSSGS